MGSVRQSESRRSPNHVQTLDQRDRPDIKELASFELPEARAERAFGQTHARKTKG